MTHCKPWDYSWINHLPTGRISQHINHTKEPLFHTPSILLQDFGAMQSFLCDFTRHIGYLPPPQATADRAPNVIGSLGVPKDAPAGM